MKKKLLTLALTAAMALTALAGCGSSREGDAQTPGAEAVAIRIGGLKGPTSMGLAKLLNDAEAGTSSSKIEYTLATAADELTPALIQGNLDMIAVPSNLAGVLYNKTGGQVSVLAVNTLGVLYIVDTGDSVSSFADLKGKTIYATGQGATPEYSLKYLLQQNGLDPEKDVTLEFKSESAEIVSLMTSSGEEIIAMLPQPFVTVAQTQVEGLNVALDLNAEWNALDNGSSLVTGVLVARNAFLQEHPEEVAAFLSEYKASTDFANENVEEVSAMIEALDIVKAPVAQKALPFCNITYLDKSDMKEAVSGYLQVLYEQNPQSVGGTLPADDFYYNAE
ncbi:MAG: ABC transporter substrate-binding protein [Muribaculaceae bacterium]|nr:ABC transporter substrate-binding protein [Roseburia sp.]MCM1429816.1 ABC transporter substrate-binding protein [Muribaculaceae bacterium]MCM1492867.1 ABC transporter substrate-binding protein [Muribaculaceae bacterium]